MPITTGTTKRISDRHRFNPTYVKQSTNRIITAAIDTDLDIPIEAGEALIAGYLGSIGSDGLLYHASPLQANNLPADGFVVKDAGVGDIGYLRQTNVINSISTITVGNDNPIFLRTGTPNYSQIPLSQAGMSENIFQLVGIPSSNISILITIREPINF